MNDPNKPTPSSTYETYETWARNEQNIIAPKLKLTSQNTERKLIATDEIHPNERIMFIPSTALIGIDNLTIRNDVEFENESRKSEYECILEISEIRKMVDCGEWRNDDTIALFLIGCRKIIEDFGLPEVVSEEIPSAIPSPLVDPAEVVAVANPVFANSSYLHHISMLPKSFPTIPLYFNTDELSRLEGTNCHVYTTRMLHQIQTDYENLVSILQNFQSNYITMEYFTLERYKWALCNIFSRATDFFVTEGEASIVKRVIAPLFDFMNHSFASQVYHSMDAAGNISVFNGPESILLNEEIFLNYGNFPNEKLLLVYGFTTLPNPYDAVQLYAPIPPSDPLYVLKTNLLTQLEIVHSDPDLLSLECVLPSTLLTKLRITGISDEMELLKLVSQSIDDERTISFLSVQNERNGLKALEHALYTMTRRLALNLIADDNLNAAAISSKQGESQGVNENLSNAKTLCSVEYEILIAALGEVRDCLDRLDVD